MRLGRSRRGRGRDPGSGSIGPAGLPRDINIDENDTFIRERQVRPRLKKPGDLSGRGLSTTAISERIVDQTESGSVFVRLSFDFGS